MGESKIYPFEKWLSFVNGEYKNKPKIELIKMYEKYKLRKEGK